MAIVRMSTLVDVARCPQCNIARPALGYRHHFFDQRSLSPIVRVWFVYACSSCDDLVAASAMIERSRVVDGQLPVWLESEQVQAERILPDEAKVDADLPERPRRYLQQALESIHSPDGATMLAGSAIDAMLKLKGLAEGSVYARIEQAVKDHILTPEMSQWAHAVRLESNKPRHADLEEPHATAEHALQVVEFAKALGEFLFVLPERIDRGRRASEAQPGPSE